MNSAFEQLVKAFADGRRVCECGHAYIPKDCGRSSCMDGNCEQSYEEAVNHVSDRVLNMLIEESNIGRHGAD